jgi:hypothetical protein
LNLITEFWLRENKLTIFKFKLSRRKRESLRRFLQLSNKGLKLRIRDMPKRIKMQPRFIRSLQKSSYCFKRNLRGLKRVIRIDSMKFGQWTKMRPWHFARRLRTVIELFMSNN